MKRKLFLGLALLLFTTAAYGINDRTIIPVDSELYSYIDSVYTEAGKVPPNNARPWTAAEMRSAAGRIDPASLSPTGRDILTYLFDKLTVERPWFEEENFAFRSDPSITVEGFFHQNLSDSTESTPESYEWIHGYEERSPFLNIPFELWYGRNLYMTTELVGKEEYRSVTSLSTPDVANNYLNILVDDPNVRLDLYFPFQAVLAAGGEWWSLLFGRDALSWGNGITGNFMLSDYSDFYDFVNLSFISESFKMTSVYAVMDRFLPDGTDIGYSGFLGHRFELRFFDRISFALSEAVTIGNRPPEILRDLNFLMIFHNRMAPESLNSLITFELSVNPWKYVTVYGQMVIDEFAVKYEVDRGGGGGPPVYGFLAGATGVYPIGGGYLNGAIEWAQTSPWLYNRRGAPYFYNVRRYWSLVTDRTEYISKPLGYEYGSDVIVLNGNASYRLPGRFKAGLDITRLLKGEKSIGAVWDPAPGDAPPSGVPIKMWIVETDASWTPVGFLSVAGGINWTYTDNPNHLAGEKRSDLEFHARVTFEL
ncbi:MAG: hypothetical protein HN368_11480 [Spirochaetales bacterium]|nr:hypothetical protein [Spirochaetales bacterium]